MITHTSFKDIQCIVSPLFNTFILKLDREVLTTNQIYWNVNKIQNLAYVNLLIQHNSCHSEFHFSITGKRKYVIKRRIVYFQKVERLFGSTECSSIMCIQIISRTLISLTHIVIHKYIFVLNKTPSHFYFHYFFFYRISRRKKVYDIILIKYFL